MLGWFKKKFGKKEAPPVPDTPSTELQEEQQPQELPVEFESSQSAQPVFRQEEPTSVDAPPPQEPERSLDEKDQESEAVDDTAAPVLQEQTALPAEDIIDSAEPKEVEEIETEAIAEIPSTEPETPTTPAVPEQPQPARPISNRAEFPGNPEAEVKPKKESSLFARLTSRLGKSRETFTYQMDALFLGKKQIDSNLLDSLEEILITADLGVERHQGHLW
jgi:fused signal recognition particle receptor